MKYFLLLSIVATSVANAQQCACSANLELLIKKTEVNYAGFHLNVKNGDRREYDKMTKTMRQKATSSSLSDCFFILRAYTDFFKDGHLGILELPTLSTAEADSLKALATSNTLTETLAESCRKI